MARSVTGRRTAAGLPEWIRPQLTQLVDAAPEGDRWLHEIKFDGYRMHARLDHGAVKLLTRTGLDWTHNSPAIARAVAALGAHEAYLDGELCGVGPDGITSFSMVQLASDSGNAAALAFYLFDLLYLDGQDFCPRPLIERKTRLASLLSDASISPHYSDHQIGHGPAFHEKACKASLEGIVSKRADAAYAPGNRGLWLKVKCLHRQEFVVLGWTDPEGSRPFLGALLLGYHDPNGRLVYAGRGLIRLLLRARRFNATLAQSEGAPFVALALREGVSRSYFTRLVRLSHLAPDITQAILDGRQPSDLTAEKLLDHSRLPLAWHDQQTVLGFG